MFPDSNLKMRKLYFFILKYVAVVGTCSRRTDVSAAEPLQQIMIV